MVIISSKSIDKRSVHFPKMVIFITINFIGFVENLL